MVSKSSRARLIIYTILKLQRSARIKLPTAQQVSMRRPNIIIECELTMRLRPLDIAVRKTPQRFLTLPAPRQDLRSLPSHRARSFSAGLTTLTMKRVSKFNERKGFQAHILKLRPRDPI